MLIKCNIILFIKSIMLHFIREYKVSLSILSLGLSIKILDKIETNKDITNITVEDIEKDTQNFSDKEKQLIDNSMIYQIRKPFPGRGYFQWKILSS